MVAIAMISASVGWLSRAPEVAVGGDEPTYVILGQSLENGRYHDEFLVGTPPHAKYPPANPLWIALVRRVAGPDLDWLRGANLLLLLLTALLLGDALRQMAGPWPGVVGLALVALNPSLIGIAGTAMSEAPFIFVTTVSLWAALRSDRSDSGRWPAVASAAAIASFLTRTIGITLIAAIGIWALRHRRWKFAMVHGALSLAMVGGWFAQAIRVENTTNGSGYAEDLRSVGQRGPGEPGGRGVGLLVQAATNARAYLTSLPWSFGIPTVRRLGIDLGVWLGFGLCCGIGLFGLSRRWPVAVIYLLLFGVALTIWPWTDVRYAFPLIPVLIASLVLGGITVAQWTPPRVRAVLWCGLALLPAVSGLTTVVRNRSNYQCNRRDPYADAKCFGPERRGMVAAARSIRTGAPKSAVVMTEKPSSVFYFSGHRTVPFERVLRPERASGVLDLAGHGVDLILLSRVSPLERTDGGAMLARHCADLEVWAALPPFTMVLATRDPKQARGNACALLSKWIQGGEVDNQHE